MIAADTNLVAYLLIQGQRTAVARRIYAADPDWVLPPLWRAEFLDVLVKSVRAGVLEQRQAREVWLSAAALFGPREREPGGTEVLDTASRFGLTAYDAQFVAVALSAGVPLVTCDRRLQSACPDHAVSPDSFLSAS
jgi:predicted nucleic acid-binding protein